MGNLSYAVLDFLSRVKLSPADATDPRLLGRLERMARAAFDGAMVALHAPVAPLTWEVNVLLSNVAGAGVQPETPRVPLTYPRPVQIVGFLPVVVNAAAPAGAELTPTTNDVLVSIDINNDERITNTQGFTTPSSGSGSTFVTLSSMSVLVPRLLMKLIDTPKPDIGFTFRYKRPNGVAGATVYAPSIITMATFARYI